MKKIFILLSLITQLFGLTDQVYDFLIQSKNDPLLKAILKCEKEVSNHRDYGDPQICVDAANLYKKQSYLTKKQKKYYGEAYSNAANMYLFSKRNKDFIKAYEMTLKAYNVGYGKIYPSLIYNLANFLRYGNGVEQNKALAYKYYLEAANLGDKKSKKAIYSLCSESPWACQK